MDGLSFYILLIRLGGLHEWEKFYLTSKPELPDHHVDLTNKVVSYSGYDEQGSPATIVFPLIALMEHKVQEEQRKALAILIHELNSRSRAERKDILQDTFELIEQLTKDVAGNTDFSAYPSVLHSLNFIKQELRNLYGKLLNSSPDTTHPESNNLPLKKKAPALPTTFTYSGIQYFKDRGDRSTAEDKLESFVGGLIDARLVSTYSPKKQAESRRSTKSKLRKIFAGDKDNQTVIWAGSKGSLTYLIRKLVEQNLIKPIPNQGHWKLAILCFKKQDGCSFTIDELKRAKNPTHTETIDKVLEHLSFSTL